MTHLFLGLRQSRSIRRRDGRKRAVAKPLQAEKEGRKRAAAKPQHTEKGRREGDF